MGALATVLDYFLTVDDDEIPRLLEQATAIYRRVQGSLSPNVAVGENQLGGVYHNRAERAHAANDLDRCMANLELALPHYREAARIHRANNHVASADQSLRNIAIVEENIRQIRIARASSSSSSSSTTT